MSFITHRPTASPRIAASLALLVPALLAALLTLVPLPLHAEEDPLTMGIFPRRSAKATVTLFQPLADHLSLALGRTVRLEAAKDFNAFWEGVKAQRYDLVHFNQYHYVKAHHRFGYEVIGHNVEFGRPDLRAAIYARHDGDIRSLADLRGRTVLFGGSRDAFIAYMAATQLLRRAGLEAGSYTEAFAKSPPNAIQGVFYRQADAGAAGDIGIRLPMVVKKIRVEELTTLAESEPFHHIPWAVHGNMEPLLRQRIQTLLTELDQEEGGRAVLKAARLNRIDAAEDADFDRHRAVIREVLGEEY